MQTKVLIIAFLIISLFGAFRLKAQLIPLQQRPTILNMQRINNADERWAPNTTNTTKRKELIADETTLTYTKTGAKIHCSNESVFNKIFTTHGTLFKRFTCTWETDRHGRYKDYVIYLSSGDADIIKSWAKTKL